MTEDPRIAALPDTHGHAKGEHKAFAEERPIPYTARMLFLWFFHACRRGSPRFLMVADHINYLTFEDPAAVNLVRRALKLAAAGDLYGAAETAGVELGHASVVSEGLRKGMRYSIGAEVDNDPRSRPDAQNIVDAMRPDGMIRSVHFLPITHPVHGENWMWPFDNREFKEFYETVGVERTWELYMAALLEAIDKLPGNIVGHFYVPAKFGHWPSDEALERYEDQLVEACAERGLAIELNSRYFYKHLTEDESQLQRYRDVNLRLLRKAKEKGVAVAVGSDAHSPRDQGAAFTEVLALLDTAGINEIAFPLNGRLARVALRATEEILRRSSAPPAPPVGSSVSGFGRAENAASARNGGASEGFEPAEELIAASPPRQRRAHAAASPEAEGELEGDEDAVLAARSGEPAPAAEEREAAEPARLKRPKRAKAAAAKEPPGESPQAAHAEQGHAEPAGPVVHEPVATEPSEGGAGEAEALPAKAAVPKPAQPKAAAAAKSAAPKAATAQGAEAKAPAAKAPALKKAALTKKSAAKKSAARPAAAKPRAAAAKKAAPARKAASKTAKRAVSPAKRAPAAKKSVAKKAPAKKKSSKTKR